MRASAVLAQVAGLPVAGRAVAVVLAAALAIAGCAAAPLQETKQFSQAFTAVNEVGQPLLDDLAVAERAQGQQLAEGRARGVLPPDGCVSSWNPLGRGFMDSFCVEDAGYFSSLSDPPDTSVLRRALLVIQQYADLLTSLADGTRAAIITAQIQVLAQNVESLAALVPAAGALTPALTPALTALKPILDQAAQAASAAEQRRLIREGEKPLGNLISSLRKAAPPIFHTLIESSVEDLEAPHPATAADLARIEGYRMVLSDYVILLGQLEMAWKTLVEASARGSGRADLATIVQISTKITANADAVRRSMVALRRGGVPAN